VATGDAPARGGVGPCKQNRCQGRSGIEKPPPFPRSYPVEQASLGQTYVGRQRPGSSEMTFERDTHRHAGSDMVS
jgi:hypothetical protein